MWSYRSLFVVILLVVLCQARVAASVLITFEDLQVPNVLNCNLGDPGCNPQNIGTHYPGLDFESNGSGGFGSTVFGARPDITPTYDPISYPAHSPITVIFTPVDTQISIGFASNLADAFQIFYTSLFDLSVTVNDATGTHNLTGPSNFDGIDPGVSSPISFVGMDIQSVTFGSDPNTFVLDDLSYEKVPEAAGYLQLSVGLLALLGGRRYFWRKQLQG